MPTATPTQTRDDAQAMPLGLDAVRTMTQLGRDLLAMSVRSAHDTLRLSAETQESAIDRVHTAFGPWVFPAVSLEAWKWWYGAGIGMLSSYADMLQRMPTQAGGVAPTMPSELDVTDASAAGAQVTQRTAAAETASARVTASARHKVT